MPNVTDIKLLQKERTLSLRFDDTTEFNLPCEYLRVFSPSAEVRGHGNPNLVSGKKLVNIVGIDPVGNYAVKLVFDDGHDSGIYSWDVFYELGQQYADNWQDYLNRLQNAGASRDDNEASA